MADDLGFSDLGCFGGEVQTPNIDHLAANGLRYRRFYNCGRCCPTRASLLTGLYAHQTGVGWMTAKNLGSDGYIGEINTQCFTLGEAMKRAGYETYMVGKWHLTSDGNAHPEGAKASWPLQRGFDKFYGIITGGGSYFTPSSLTYGNERIQAPKGYYLTDALSDTASSFIKQQQGENRPFFMYLAFTAPHFPLHAKQEDIKQYIGKYNLGWEHLRRNRHENLMRLGILDSQSVLSPPEDDVPVWEHLTPYEKEVFERRMAVYAAQIDIMDQGIGRVIESLKAKGQFDNTIIFFMSDNGGSSERISRGDKDSNLIGTDKTFESYRKPWAALSNSPFRMYKQWVHEGGIATPMIVHWPNGIVDKNSFRDQPAHVIDLMPTCIALANGHYPDSFNGHHILPMEGINLISTFQNNSFSDRKLFWEHQATRAVSAGDWKLVADRDINKPPYILDWELYNLDTDRSELNNLADLYPEKVAEMDSLWNAWAVRCDVYPLDGRGWGRRMRE